ncbi:MAG: hypothetical protein FWG40_10245, partial [Peptococcaceae bacterium]|nr:hypothetical protein [Peptococcaceae bacterium]
KGAKAAEEAAQATKILKEAEAAMTAMTVKDGEAVIAAAKAADEAAKAKKIFDPLHWREDFTLWKDQPQLVTPEGLSLGKPHTSLRSGRSRQGCGTWRNRGFWLRNMV